MVTVGMVMEDTDTEQKEIDTGVDSVYNVSNSYGKNWIYFKYKKENNVRVNQLLDLMLDMR